MGKNDLITPILVEVENVLYKLIYINFKTDGSIYVNFPRKCGYKVSTDIDLPNFIFGKQSFNLESSQPNYLNPYISFHPRKNVIHINTQNNGIYKLDARVINLSEDASKLVFSLSQIVFTAFSYLDVYKSSKYIFPFILNSKSLNPIIDLCIEIWVHPVNGYIQISDLPLFESRREQTNIVGASMFKHKRINQYTCTLIISELTSKNENERTPGITVLVLNEKRPYAFRLNPEK